MGRIVYITTVGIISIQRFPKSLLSGLRTPFLNPSPTTHWKIEPLLLKPILKGTLSQSSGFQRRVYSQVFRVYLNLKPLEKMDTFFLEANP